MLKAPFSKTTIQMLIMSFVGVAVMLVMSLYVGSSLKDRTRDPASAKATSPIR